MKGTNKLELNKETMLDVIQFYCDHVLFQSEERPIASDIGTDASYDPLVYKITLITQQENFKRVLKDGVSQ